MDLEKVELFFKDDERAGGVVKLEEMKEMPWTAIRNAKGHWYIVLHGELDRGDASLLRLVLDSIQRSLVVPLAKAA